MCHSCATVIKTFDIKVIFLSDSVVAGTSVETHIIGTGTTRWSRRYENYVCRIFGGKIGLKTSGDWASWCATIAFSCVTLTLVAKQQKNFLCFGVILGWVKMNRFRRKALGPESFWFWSYAMPKDYHLILTWVTSEQFSLHCVWITSKISQNVTLHP